MRHETVLPGVVGLSLVSDRTFPRHSHDEFGFGYIVEGGQESWSGRGQVEATAGNVITVNPGELHDGIGRAGAPRGWRMLFLTPEALQRYVEAPVTTLEFHHPVIQAPQQHAAIQRAIDTSCTENAEPALVEEGLVLALGSLLAPAVDRDTGPSNRSEATIRVLAFIAEAWDEPICLDDLARVSGLSRFRVLRVFSRDVGTTPHAYLIQHRLKHAKRLVGAGMPLAEAALACGFADQSHLTRLYLRQYGLSPGQDRGRAAE
ncbi:MAG: AraC family transcriptional regulator [Pseudomonadota bacterium]